MQYYVNMFLKGLPELILLALIITGIFLIISRSKISQEKRINRELQECITCKDGVLEEFKKNRHEYNNILQTLICFIEDEDCDSLKEYKSKLLEKTKLLNMNSLTQLAKIKDKNILRMVYKLFMDGEEAGITLHITIYNDIADINSNKKELFNTLQNYLRHAYECAINEATEISLKINSNDMGLRFCFENTVSEKPEINISMPLKSLKNTQMSKNIFFNTFRQNNRLIQEILINFNV